MIFHLIALSLLLATGSSLFCPSSQTLVKIHRVYSSNAEKETLEVWRDNSINGQKVFTGTGAGRAYQRVVSEFCWDQRVYAFKLSSTDSNGWSEGSYFYVVAGGVELLRGTLRGVAMKEMTLSLQFLVPVLWQWRYSEQDPGNKGWTQSLPYWTSYTTGSFPSVSSTRYYATLVTVTEQYKTMPIWEVDVFSKGGFILYINGQEVNRVNLPATQVTHSTRCVAAPAAASWHRVTLFGAQYASLSSLLVAVEMHPCTDQPDADEFEAVVIPSMEQGINRLSGVTVTAEVDGQAVGEPSSVVDGLSSTYFSATAAADKEVVLTFDLNGNRHWFNRYSIQSAPSNQAADVTEWQLLGSVDGVDWKQLDYRTDEVFSERRQVREFSLDGLRTPFAYVRLVLKKRLDDDSTTIQTGDVQVYAKEEQGTKQLSYGNYLAYYVDFAESLRLEPQYAGYTNFAVSPALPESITLNPINGVISGQLNSTMAGDQEYHVNATNVMEQKVEETSFLLSIRTCDLETKAMVEVRKYNVRGSNSDYVGFQKGQIESNTIRGEDAENIRVYRYCMDRTPYTVYLATTNEDGWNAGAAVEFYVFYDSKNSVLVGRKTLRGSSRESFEFNTAFDLPKASQPFMVFTGEGEPPSDWKNGMAASESWTSYNLENGVGPAVDRPVWFIKQQVTTSSVSTSSAASYELGVYCRAGVVLYVNGKEVYRSYVGEGEVSSNSTITGGKRAPFWHRVVGLQKNFITGVNTIAMAIVNTPANRNITIDANLRLYFSQSPLPIPVSVSAEASDSTTGFPASNLFDGNYATRAMMPRASNDTVTGPQYWGFSFDDESAVAVSRYCFVSNDAAGRFDPTRWELYASATGKGDTLTQWTALGAWEGLRWNSRNERMCFTIPTIEFPYRYYRFVLRENAGQTPDNFYGLAEIELFTVNVESYPDADLSYNPSSVIVYYGIAMSSMQPSAAGFSQFSITPELPYGLSIDAYTGVISGTPVGAMEMTSYSVTCKNQRGSTRTATIAITIQSCVLPNRLFSVSVPEVGEQGSNMVLQLAADQSVNFDGLRDYASHTVTLCAAPRLSSLTFKSKNSYGLGSKVAVVRLADNRELLRTGATTNAVQFYPFYAVDESSSWKYNYGALPQEGWQVNNGTAEWPATEAGKFPATESIAQYYTTTFSLTDVSRFVALDLQVRIQAGMRVWLNGEPIAWANLPFTEVTNATLASTQYAIPQIRKSSMRNAALLQETNTLAVEIHRGSSIPASNTFMLKLLPLVSGQTRMVEGAGSASVPGVEGHEASKAFDLNENTFYMHEGVCEGSTLQWEYSGASQHYLNQYSIVSGGGCQNLYPQSWKLEGSRDGQRWTLLDIRTSETFGYTSEKKSYLFYNGDSFSAFRLTVLRCQTSSSVSGCAEHGLHIRDLSFEVFSVGDKAVCPPADGFPETVSGSYAYADCEMNYSGYKRRLCLNGVYQSVERFCTVAAPSSFSYPQESYELVAAVPVSPPLTPTIVCNDCGFTVEPELPEGLALDAATGAISGTPANITENAHYTIVASNVAGSATVVLDLLATNETVHCYMDLMNGWEATLANTTAVKGCPNLVDYEGNVTRFCNYGSPAFWSAEENHCELLLPNITLTETTFSFVKNEMIAPIVPIISGSGITSRSISPRLPSGLYFNPATATITGKPTQKVAQTTYTITVQNKNGASTATLTITVTSTTCPANDGWAETDSGDTAYKVCEANKEGNWYRVCSAANPPMWQNAVNECHYIKPIVTYSSATFALQRGQSVNLVPQTQFYITTWTLSGTLPAGLSFSNSNGAITGTPTTITQLSSVTISASNPDKVTQVTLTFSVNVYKCNADGVWPETEVGQTFTLACDNPTLMEGDRKRTCNFVSGSVAWGEVADTCKYMAPILTYQSTTITVRKGESLSVTPTTGNQIDSITITPALPAGLAFHAGSGAISGTPTGDASNHAYTVVAANRDARTEVVLQIIVSVAACAGEGVWRETERGETAYAWCESGAGVQSRVCGSATDVNPQWKEIDNSGCVASPEKQKPTEGRSFVRFTLQLAGVAASAFDARAYAALREVLVSGLAAQSVTAADVLIESHNAGSFSVLAEGTVLGVRIATGLENGEQLKAAVVTLGQTTLTSLVRNSGVAALGSATATVVESSFTITKYSLFNSLATVLIVLVIVLGVILLLIGVFLFLTRRKSSGKKSNHNRLGSSSGKSGQRTKHADVKGSKHRYEEEEEKPRKKAKKASRYEDEEEEERPKRKSRKYEEEEEEERPKRKSRKYEEEEEKPKRKSRKYEDDEEEERPKKKSKKSRKYEDSD